MNDLTKEISLIDELSAPTTERLEVAPQKTEQTEINQNTDDFLPIAAPPEITEEVAQVLPVEAPENTTTPEESAESIIDIIDLSITSISLPVMAKKLKKKFGEEAFENAQLAIVKEALEADKLTDEEKVLIAKYRRFEVILKQIRSEVPFSDEEVRKLKPSTIRLCEKHGIQVTENVAFGANVLKVLSSRIIDIVML